MSRDPLTTEQVHRALADTAATLPIVNLVSTLFTDPQMFRSFDRFSDAGFDLVDHSPHKIMTGFHDRAPGYLFKKYDNEKPGEKQLQNYMRRIEGAKLIRTFITAHGFSRVVTPQKWLYELPPAFPQRYLLVVEKIELVSRRATERAYDDIAKQQLRELATILYYFRGLNSTAANLPYTKAGQIAFIDTERWHHDKPFLHKVGDRLPRKRRKQAEQLFDDLKRQGARPFVSSFE